MSVFLTDVTILLIPCKVVVGAGAGAGVGVGVGAGGGGGKGGNTHLSCSPVISTSASRSSSAAFFCMVFPIPSMSVLTHDARNKDISLQRDERASAAVSFYMLKKNLKNK